MELTIQRNCRIKSFDILHSKAKSVRTPSSSSQHPKYGGRHPGWTSSGPSSIACFTFLFMEETRKRMQVCDGGVKRFEVSTFCKLIEVY